MFLLKIRGYAMKMQLLNEKDQIKNIDYDFDTIINRYGTNSYKWDIYKGNTDIISLSIADMDFMTSPEIIDELVKRVKFGVFGYEFASKRYNQSIIHWMDKKHNWKIKTEWIVCLQGVITGIKLLIEEFSNIGESIIIQTPVYQAFGETIKIKNRKIICSSLKYENNKYSIDFDIFESLIIEHKVKILILCNPHNPIGRIWSIEELRRLGEICLKYQVLIICDETHQDFVGDKSEFHTFLTAVKKCSDISFICTSPCKSFNLAGLQVSNFIIPNKELRDRFIKRKKQSHTDSINCIGLLACEVAYEKGEPWLKAVNKYVNENTEYVSNFIQENLPELQVVQAQATYLLWINCKKLDFNNAELEDFFINKVKINVVQGYVYGDDGSGFIRMNLACSRKVLCEVLRRLKEEISKLHRIK